MYWSRWTDSAERTPVMVIGGVLSLNGGPNVLHCGIGQTVQFLTGDCLLDGGNSLQPCVVADALLSAKTHALAPFRDNARATAPLSSTVIRLPTVL